MGERQREGLLARPPPAAAVCLQLKIRQADFKSPGQDESSRCLLFLLGLAWQEVPVPSSLIP